jgi:hypothetical protein
MDVDNLIWENIRSQLEIGFWVTPTVSSVIQKLQEIRQKYNVTVIQYICRCAEILLEFKTKSDAVEANMQLQLNAAKTAAYNGIEEALRLRKNREIKQKAQALTFHIISGFHLIAGFKAKIRAGLMKNKGQLFSIAMIKAEAMQLELIVEEEKKKSTTGTNGNYNGNGKQAALINEVEEEGVEDIKGKRNGYKGQNYNPNYQNTRTNPSLFKNGDSMVNLSHLAI